MRRKFFIGLFAASSLVLAPASLSAQAPDADRVTARAMAEEGQAALERRDYRVAEDRFTRADALIHAPTLMLGLARAQLGLGKLVEAHESYQRILREGVKPGAPPAFSKAVSEAGKEVEAVAGRLAWVTLDVSPAADAEVTLDGMAVPRAALGFKRPVNPGTHRLRVTAPGYLSREETFSLSEAAKTALTIQLMPDPGARIATADVAAGAQGTAKGSTAVDPRAGAAGDREKNNAMGGGPLDSDVGVSDRGRANRIAGGVSVILGGAGLVTGAVAGGLALRKRNELKDACPEGACRADRQNDIDTFHKLTTVSTIGFIAGAVGVSAGVVLFLTAPSGEEPRPPTARVSPYIGWGTAGVRGHF